MSDIELSQLRDSLTVWNTRGDGVKHHTSPGTFWACRYGGAHVTVVAITIMHPITWEEMSRLTLTSATGGDHVLSCAVHSALGNSFLSLTWLVRQRWE
jgi:hypothetical protein